MAQKEIKTSIQIKASPARVWEVLTDFQAYPNWNPFIKSIQGDMQVGNSIHVEAGGMKFKPKVLAYEKNKELRWIGRLLTTGIFDGEHVFIINDNGDGTVTFRQEEKFNGILVGLFAKKLDNDTKHGFIQMNEKLKQVSELG